MNNPADLKELIPEFFTGTGQFLCNSEGLNMGHKHTGIYSVECLVYSTCHILCN